jgi:ABC-type branched-subunit amino acid transport system substrate-binding protein
MANSEKPVVEATLLAIEEINEKGGVLGRPVEAVVEDGASDWPTFARLAGKLITQDRVCTVFGCWTSASRKTVKPIFEKHGHLLFYPVQYEGLEQSPNIVYTGAAPNQQILPAVKWCCAFLEKKRLFLVGSDYVFPRCANAIIRDQAASLGGQIVGEEYLLLGSQDVAGVVAKIAAAKPDIILNTINGDTNVAFFRALRAAGITAQKIPTISFSLTEEELTTLNAWDVVGDYGAWNYFMSIDRPQNHAFVRRFQAKFGQHRLTNGPSVGSGGPGGGQHERAGHPPGRQGPAFRCSPRAGADRSGDAAHRQDGSHRQDHGGPTFRGGLHEGEANRASPLPDHSQARGVGRTAGRSAPALGREVGQSGQVNQPARTSREGLRFLLCHGCVSRVTGRCQSLRIVAHG